MSEAEMKKELFQAIDVRKEELLRIADYICDNPEVGLKEYKASVFLSEYLRQNGFSVELGVGGLDTAFRAVWENGTGGPSIGFCVNTMRWKALAMGADITCRAPRLSVRP